MDVTLLGTGAADGWPNPWCPCASCADNRRLGLVRANTSALVDDRLLLDAGADMNRAAAHAGRDLTQVTTVCITHAHDDHCHPSFLLHRAWLDSPPPPLRVIGPAPVIASCREWLEPGDESVTFVQVTAGDVVEVDGYRITALPATHEAFGEAVLYAISDGSSSLLYATDTGPWAPGVREGLAGWQLDLVMLEETFGEVPSKSPHHHDLATFGAALADLRAWGNIHPSTRCVAIHLGHHNPPLARLQGLLAAIDAEVYPDGTALHVGSRKTV